MEGLTVLIPTYNRQEILVTTILNLLHNLEYTDGEIHILVGDDGDNYDKTLEYVNAAHIGSFNVNVIAGPQNGLGANLNMLLQAAPTEIVMQMDDDHWLERKLNIDEYMHELEVDPAFGWIRLFMGLKSDSDNKKTYYSFTGQTYGRYWRLIPYESGLYIPSNRPHLKCKDFHRRYGPYLEGVRLGEQESGFCHQFKDGYVNDGLLDVFVPMYPPPIDTWKHAGDSWQKKGL